MDALRRSAGIVQVLFIIVNLMVGRAIKDQARRSVIIIGYGVRRTINLTDAAWTVQTG
jgi:hypothetical protein